MLAALAGAGVSAYLSAVRLAGTAAVCGPSHGCDIVAASEYAEILGIPVAWLGLACSVVLVALAATWWRRAERSALLGAYLLLLAATGFVAYLTYLELFVIEAICPWCVAYAVTVLLALAVAGLALWRTAGTPASR